MSIRLERLAQAVGNNSCELRQRLISAKQCLVDEVRFAFGRGSFDFENKRLIGNNGLILQWKLRMFPDRPDSYENQQTSKGCVVLVRSSK